MGTETLFSIPFVGPVARVRAPTREMDRVSLERWNQRVVNDLNWRVGNRDSDWSQLELMVRNTTPAGRRRGNLVEQFLQTMKRRLFTTPWHVHVRADDPEYKNVADDSAIVGQSVWRIVQGERNLKKVAQDSMWAMTGWLEMSHPLDPENLDVNRVFAAPNTSIEDRFQGPDMRDQYQPVSPEMLAASGINPEDVPQWDPFTPLPDLEGPIEGEPAKPVFRADNGYPYLTRVDPRLIVIPPDATEMEELSYVARIRFMTPGQLERLSYTVDKKMTALPNYLGGIYEKTRNTSIKYLPRGVVPVVQLYIKFDEECPEYNNFYVVFPLDFPQQPLRNGPNPYRGMIPIHPVKVFEHKGYWDDPPAMELREFANLYDISLQSLARRIKRSKSQKILIGPGAGLTPDEANKINNDDYNGGVRVNDPQQFKAFTENAIDPSLLYVANFVRSLGGAAVGSSPMEQGQPTKDVTARQTVALQDAQGVLVESIKAPLSEAGGEVILKLMHMLGLFSHQGAGRSYSFGDKIARVSAGEQDFTTSFVYDVSLSDVGDEGSETMMLMMNFLKVVLSDAGGQMSRYVNMEELTERLTSAFGLDRGVLLRYSGPTTGTAAVAPGTTGVDPAVNGNGQDMTGGTGASVVQSEEHPERLMGSQGVGRSSNALDAMRR